MATSQTIIIGHRKLTSPMAWRPVDPGEIAGFVLGAVSANCWVHTAKVWTGQDITGGDSGAWERPIVYNTTGTGGSGGPSSLAMAFEPLGTIKYANSPNNTKIYTVPLRDGAKGQKAQSATVLAMALHGRNAQVKVGKQASFGDTATVYSRANVTNETPPNPMGWTTSAGSGELAAWLEADQNLAPLAPTSVSPTGYIGTITPTISATFRDPNGANGDGVDRGDLMSAALVQVRRKSDLVTMWDVEYPATEAERAANQSIIVYGSKGSATTLVKGTTYQLRIAHKDDFGTLGPWSSWVDFTPAPQGLAAIGTNPVAGKIDALQPSVDIAWTHQALLSTNAVQVQFWKGSAKVFDSGTVSKIISSGSSSSMTWAALGLSGQLEAGTTYTVLAYGRDSLNIWSGASQPREFTTDSAPGIPSALSPTGNVRLSSSIYPKLSCTVVDRDDTPATGLVVKAEILTAGGSLISTRAMSLVSGTTDRFEYQTTGSDLAVVGNYKWRAYAGDGYLWSGVQTIEGSAVRSAESLFQWVAGPAVTITAPASSATLDDDTPSLTWTVSAQDKYQIRALDAVTNAEVYSSGWITDSVARAASVPVGYTRNGGVYDFEVGVEKTSLQGFAVATDVTITYTPPPALANFQVLPEIIGDDPFATSARITFDAYTGSGFAGYQIERSDLPGPLFVETSIGQTGLSDYHAPLVPVVYTGRVIVAKGVGEYVRSDPVSVLFSLDMQGVALVSLAQPVTQRFVTRQRGARRWNLRGEEDEFLPRGASAPIAKTGVARWQDGELSFKLRRELGDPETDRLALEELAQSGAGLSYRDRSRREFMRIPVDGGMEIEDQGNGGYDVTVTIKRSLYVEGGSS